MTYGQLICRNMCVNGHAFKQINILFSGCGQGGLNRNKKKRTLMLAPKPIILFPLIDDLVSM